MVVPDGHIPAPLSSFVGRREEIEAIAEVLTRYRLVTLTGPGGVGKTRLAIEAARAVADRYGGGVWFVDGAAIDAGDAVLPALACAVGVTNPGSDARRAIAARVGSAPALLLVDNCEHLVDAFARELASLLGANPALSVLATSREALRIGGEARRTVAPLALPEPDADDALRASSDAVRLFIERADAAGAETGAGFELHLDAVEDVCRRVEGLPLAIELAAARTRVVGIDAVRAGLADPLRSLAGGDRAAPARSRSLLASVAWSYDLLDGETRRVLDRLSVFVGDFTLGAARAVAAGDGIEPDAVLDLLSGLVDRSLVMPADSSSRFRLLDTVRAFAYEQLDAAGAVTRTEQRLVEHFLLLTEEAERGLEGPEQEEWLGRLDADIPNLRAAMGAARSTGVLSREIGLVIPVWLFWLRRHVFEGAQRVRDIAARLSDGDVPIELEALTRFVAAFLTFATDTGEQAIPLAQVAVAAAQRSGSAMLEGRCLHTLGAALFATADENAMATHEETRIRTQESGDLVCLSEALLYLARETVVFTGDMARARELAAESLIVANSIPLPVQVQKAQMVSTELVVAAGDLRRARIAADATLAAARGSGDTALIAQNLSLAGTVRFLQGETADAVDLCRRGVETLERGGAASSLLSVAHRRLGEALLAMGDSSGAAESLTSAVDFALAIDNDLARLSCAVPLTRAQLALGRTADARVTADRAVELASRFPNAPDRAAALLVTAAVAYADGDDLRAAVGLREALSVRGIDRATRIAAVAQRARIAARSGDAEIAARLLGAADAARQEMGLAVWPDGAAIDAATIAAVIARIGETAAAALRAEGAGIHLDEAARLGDRRRGRRRRAAAGWESLTATENDVVKFVSEGLRNDEIAARMYIAPRTVTSHLTHVYAKLGVRSRVQLVRAMADRTL